MVQLKTPVQFKIRVRNRPEHAFLSLRHGAQFLDKALILGSPHIPVIFRKFSLSLRIVTVIRRIIKDIRTPRFEEKECIRHPVEKIPVV